MEFEVTRQCDVFHKIQQDKKFHISDDLLFDCIGLGCGNWHRANRFQGFNSGKAFGYALLTYFSSIALDFRRLPFCEDRIYTSYFDNTEKYIEVISQLSPSRIDNISKEIKGLYEHTQAALRQIGLKTVNLRREIKKKDADDMHFGSRRTEHGYAETLVILRESCDVLGLTEFEIEMDTLNSFGDEGAYVSEVKLELAVPASDILYCSALVGNRPGEQEPIESGEWVVRRRCKKSF